MAEFQPAYLVQDTESGLFLCPRDGDVGYCKLVTQAGPFDSYDEAFETAVYNIGARFVIFSCALMVKH
ncbi:hypothetical protein [Chitiniphilus eburneus]|uniref:hypothetical protein n=1 Tax=Chitiniphilus eburneus TaxID=2571148 RepID=UPI0035CF2962